MSDGPRTPTFHGVAGDGVDERDPVLRCARGLAGMASVWHRAELLGWDRVPAGPVLLVGNHGLLGLETPVFFYLLHCATGRYPVGLADRNVFGLPPIRNLLARVGGVIGSRENALDVLRQRRLVVCYPGGHREVFKRSDHRYRLQWDRARGFARLAIEAQVPVVPFAGLGVDESWIHLGHNGPLSRVLGRYTPPMVMGLGLLPLPVQFRFVLGHPLLPPKSERALEDFRQRVRGEVEALLEDHGAAQTQPAPAFH